MCWDTMSADAARVMELACGHSLCKNCFNQMGRTTETNYACPICRGAMPKSAGSLFQDGREAEMRTRHEKLGVQTRKEQQAVAEAKFREALELDAEHAESQFMLAQMYKDQGKLPAARRHADEAVRLLETPCLLYTSPSPRDS